MMANIVQSSIAAAMCVVSGCVLAQCIDFTVVPVYGTMYVPSAELAGMWGFAAVVASMAVWCVYCAADGWYIPVYERRLKRAGIRRLLRAYGEFYSHRKNNPEQYGLTPIASE